jgi:hypothetical protein
MTREQIIKLAQQFGLMMRDQPMHGVEALAKAAYEAGAATERVAILRHAMPAHDVDGHSEIVTVADIRARETPNAKG